MYVLRIILLYFGKQYRYQYISQYIQYLHIYIFGRLLYPILYIKDSNYTQNKMDMYQNTQLQNQAIYEIINNSYLQHFHPFINTKKGQTQIYSISTVCINWFQHYMRQEQNMLIGITNGRCISLPILRNWWIYVGQVRNNNRNNINDNNTIQISKQIQKKQHNQYKYQHQKEYVLMNNCKKMGKSILLSQYQQQITNRLFQLRLFKQLEQKNIVNNSQVVQQYLVTKFINYFGIFIDQKMQQKQQQLNNNKYKILNYKIINNPNINQQLIQPIFIQYQNLVYIKGFKIEGFQIILTKQLITLLNNKLTKIQGILNLGSEKIDIVGLKYISQNIYQNLQNLNLWWNMIGEQGIKVLLYGHFPVLRILDLRKNYIGDDGLKFFSYQFKNNYNFKKCLPNLQKLLLTDNNLTSLINLFVDCVPSLKQLQLQNNKFIMNQNNKIYIPDYKRLKILSLRNNLITGQGLNKINLTNLQYLYLTNNNIINCQSLSSAYLPCLKILNLSKNKITTIKWLRKSTFAIQNDINYLKGLSGLDISENLINQLQGLFQMNWLNLKQLRINNPSKKSDLIRQPDQINNLNCLYKWNLIQSNLSQNYNNTSKKTIKLYNNKNRFNNLYKLRNADIFILQYY